MPKLGGLSDLEIGRLRMSLGYGRNKKDRPLSPTEVAILLSRICDAGHTLDECSDGVGIDKTGLVRFLSILNLPEDLQYLIGWGSGENMIGFSSATELVRIDGIGNQRKIADSILRNGLNSKEVRQVVQLVKRSDRSVDLCLEEVLGMRSTIERRYVFIGSVVDENVQNLLGNLSQRQRDMLLRSAMEHIGLQGASGRLGGKVFSLVGGDVFEASMKDVGKNDIEDLLGDYIGENLINAC